MIRVFTLTAPLGDKDPDTAVATLNAAADMLRRLYPAFLSAQGVADQNVLTLTLRISARDQFACITAARKIGTNMLLRVRIPADQGTLQLVGSEPSARSLTKERGRNVSGHRKRGAMPAEGSSAA